MQPLLLPLIFTNTTTIIVVVIVLENGVPGASCRGQPIFPILVNFIAIIIIIIISASSS
jgi:hypothetical protein